jgi:hypothetical protein
VQYNDNGIVSGASNFVWDKVNGRVGIGTATPAYPLHVVGTGYFSSVLTLGGASRISAEGSNALNLNTNSVDRLTIDSSGNVGVAATPSAWGTNSKAVQVGGGSAAVSSTGAGSTASRFTHGCYFDNTNWKYQNTSVGPALYEQTGANGGSTHAWYVAPGGTAGNNITFTQAMTLDASGNLLVGTVTSPAGTKVGAIAKLSGVSVEGTASIAVSTVATKLARVSGLGGLFFVQGYADGSGQQAWWLVAATNTTTSVIGSNNPTGLVPTFTMVSAALHMVLASGTFYANSFNVTA